MIQKKISTIRLACSTIQLLNRDIVYVYNLAYRKKTEGDEMMELKIAEKLRFYRRKAGYTQEEMAAHLGVSFQAISKWERGYGYPDITMLRTFR